MFMYDSECVFVCEYACVCFMVMCVNLDPERRASLDEGNAFVCEISWSM